MWQQILEAIEEMRRQEGVVRLFPQFLNGEDLFGLNEPAIIRVLESLNYLWLSVDHLDSRKQSVKERNIVTIYIYVCLCCLQRAVLL